MPHLRFESREISRRGAALYETLRPLVETEASIGKIISVDIETGDYEIGDYPVQTARVQAKHAGAAIYGARIGYRAVFNVGSPRIGA